MYQVGVLDAIFNIPPVGNFQKDGPGPRKELELKLGYQDTQRRRIHGHLEHCSDEDNYETAETEIESPCAHISAKRTFSKAAMSRLFFSTSHPAKSTVETSSSKSKSPKMEAPRDATRSVDDGSKRLTSPESKLKKSLKTKGPVTRSSSTRPLLYHTHPYTNTFPPMIPCTPQLQPSPMPQRTVALPAYSKRLQDIQTRIDMKNEQLNHDPNNAKLREEMSTFQQERNDILNAVVAKIPVKRLPSEMQGLLPEDYTTSNRVKVPEKISSKPFEPTVDIEVPRHHLCSNCHKVRSQKYHQLHSISPNQKPIHNLCEQCKNTKPQFLSGLHFCYSCGVVRSKSFHHRHSSLAEDEPNYCGKCVSGVAKSKIIAESSFVTQNYTPSNTETCSDSTLSPTPAQVKEQSVLLQPSSKEPVSYYCPARPHSSNQRRAQRADTQTQTYIPPYVQDASETVSPQTDTFKKDVISGESDTTSIPGKSDLSESISSASTSSPHQSESTKFWNGAFGRRTDVTTMFVETGTPSFAFSSEQEYTRFSRGAFGSTSPCTSAGLSWNTVPGYCSPPHSPQWCNFSSTYCEDSPKERPKERTSFFASKAKSFSHNINPVPITEEPLSPPASPVQSPRLLEFATEDDVSSLLSDSVVH